MDSSRNPAEDTETDVDQEIRTAAPAEEYRNGWEEDGEEVEKYIGSRRSAGHFA